MSSRFGTLGCLVVVGAVGGFPVRSAAGQTTAPLVLRLPASPRPAGFGDAFIGGTGSDVVFYNPSQIGDTPGLSLSAARYRTVSTQASLASSTRLGRFAVAAFARWLDYGTSGFPTSPDDLTQRGDQDGASLAAGGAIATSIMGFRLGTSVSFVEERVANVHGSVPAVDVGISKELDWLTVGAVASHLGPRLNMAGTRAELPTRIGIGATTSRYSFAAFFDVAASAAVYRERDGTITPAGGVELTYEPVSGWTASVRVGARRVDQSRLPGLQPFTVGASLGLDRFSLDYGFEAYRGLGAAHRFGIRIQ